MATPEEFIAAQSGTWPDVKAELMAGQKTSHWIWWVFPQLASLGRSPRARHFGLSGLEEATRYLRHPVLGARLVEVTELLLTHEALPPDDILGPVDAMKVKSCMTLFEAVPDAPAVFARVLDRMYAGERCQPTIAALPG